MNCYSYILYKQASTPPTYGPVFNPSMQFSPDYYNYMMGKTPASSEGGFFGNLFKGPVTKGKLIAYGLGGGSAVLGLGAYIHSKRKRKERENMRNILNR